MSDSTLQIDSLFSTIADISNGIDPLLDSFFSFLSRKTDFYHQDTYKKDSSKNILLKYYEKNKELYSKLENIKKEKMKNINQDNLKLNIQQVTKDSTIEKQHAKLESKEDIASVNTDSTVEDDSLGPVGNGGSTDKYTWTQMLPSVEVFIPIKYQTPARDCDIIFSSTELKILVKGETIVDGKFYDKIVPSESFWTIEDKRQIHLVFEKQDKMKWWSCVIHGDPEIDTKKIVPENSKLSDLDPELRQTVEKMMFDQEQKTLGLPTSEQLKQAEILESFKRAHPEMDFSKAKMGNW